MERDAGDETMQVCSLIHLNCEPDVSSQMRRVPLLGEERRDNTYKYKDRGKQRKG